MTELKCPFCHKRLQNDDLLCSCINEKCEESFDMVGTELLWQKVIDLQDDLIDTKKKLDIAVDALKIIGSGKVIEHSVMFHEDDNKIFIANKALEQITALEQKDVK